MWPLDTLTRPLFAGTGGMALGHGFVEGFLKSWGVILASEIGDKTFFIAAILAMRHPRQTVRTRGGGRRRRREGGSGSNAWRWPACGAPLAFYPTSPCPAAPLLTAAGVPGRHWSSGSHDRAVRGTGLGGA